VRSPLFFSFSSSLDLCLSLNRLLRTRPFLFPFLFLSPLPSQEQRVHLVGRQQNAICLFFPPFSLFSLYFYFFQRLVPLSLFFSVLAPERFPTRASALFLTPFFFFFFFFFFGLFLVFFFFFIGGGGGGGGGGCFLLFFFFFFFFSFFFFFWGEGGGFSRPLPFPQIIREQPDSPPLPLDLPTSSFLLLLEVTVD